MLLRHPGFTLIAVLTLALGIGANTAIFSVVSAVLLRPLPYPESDKLVMVWEKRIREGSTNNAVAPADLRDWRIRNQVFADIAAEVEGSLDLSDGNEPERITAGQVSASFFDVLGYSVEQRTHEIGVRMALGAQTSDVRKLIVRRGMALALTGAALGLLASFVLTRVLESMLFGVSVTDPLTLAVVPVLLLAIALPACWMPAWRASKVDPLVALRHE
jgi:FtsX-like permease family protein/MacB-like protein